MQMGSLSLLAHPQLSTEQEHLGNLELAVKTTLHKWLKNKTVVTFTVDGKEPHVMGEEFCIWEIIKASAYILLFI